MCGQSHLCRGLVAQLSAEELAVHTADVAELDVLRTFSSASTSVGTVTETEFVHLSHHSFHAALSLGLALWKKCELAHLS